MSNPMLLNANDYVRIINEGDEVVEGRFAGVDYTFRIGEYVDVPLVVAAHIFGFGADEKVRASALARLGWVKNSGDIKDAMKRLGKFKFSELPNVVELVQRPKIGRAGPLGAGGMEGAAVGALPPPPAPEDPLAADGESIDTPVIGERI